MSMPSGDQFPSIPPHEATLGGPGEVPFAEGGFTTHNSTSE